MREVLTQTSHKSLYRNIRAQATPGFPAGIMASNDGLLAAMARGDAEVRFFGQQLERLPSLRVRGKPVDTLALQPGKGDHLAVGSIDGQVLLYSLSDHDEAPVRLHRLLTESSEQQTFAGLHFAARHQIVAAAKGQRTAALLDVEVAGKLPIAVAGFEDEAASGLVFASRLCESNVLLMDSRGLVRVWDVRSPVMDCSQPLLLFPPSNYIAASVDAFRWHMAASTHDSVCWADLRAPRSVELMLQYHGRPWFPQHIHRTHSRDPHLVFTPRGSLLASWNPTGTVEAPPDVDSLVCIQPHNSFSCLFTAIHEPGIVTAGPTPKVVLSSCRSVDGVSVALSLATYRKSFKGRSDWHFEVVTVGTTPSVLSMDEGDPMLLTPFSKAVNIERFSETKPERGINRAQQKSFAKTFGRPTPKRSSFSRR